MELFAVDTAPSCTSMCGGASSAIGHRHAVNEDAFVCGPVWFAVADGMGGHRAGDLASREAIDVLRGSPAGGSIAELRAVVDEVNVRVRHAATELTESGMGTTLVAAAEYDGGVAVVSVGDSRCYRLTGGMLTLVTHDHTHVQELVDLGRITPDEAHAHRLRHVVTRAIGVDAVARPDIVLVDAPAGRLLLCSDGLTAHVPPRTIGRVLSGIDDPQAAAERLVGLATCGASSDDVTAVVVDHICGAS